MRPTSPRGAIPTPTAQRLNLRHGTAQPLTSLPSTAIANSVPAMDSVARLAGSAGFHTLRSNLGPVLREKDGVKQFGPGLKGLSIALNLLGSVRNTPDAK